MARKIVLRTHLSLGDIVCFTSAIRELHQQFPGEFTTDIRTPFPAVWEQNPDITPMPDGDPDVEYVDCHYDRDGYVSVHRSNQHPVHLIEGYCQDVANSLGLHGLRPTELKGQIFLSQDEYSWMSLPHEKFNCQRYWILCLGGGKKDHTTKWYIPESVQQVVNHFRGRIQFVQVGSANDEWNWHPDIDGVIDLRGQTDVRQLIRLVHSACGVLCGITSLMHLAAAVPIPLWQKRPRPCVVVAGGREPRTWYGYPTHRILETIGALQCCRDGGCWHGRTLPLGDDPEHDRRLCERVIAGHPKCMWMIRPESIIAEVENYLEAESVE